MSNSVLMGVDIGQKRDPTAICVVEVEEREEGKDELKNHFLVRHLESLPLGTPYPGIAAKVSKLAMGIEWRTDRRAELFVDATGIGQPIVDFLRQETSGLGSITPIYFTHGDQRTREGGQVRLGKAYLVSRLQMLLQTGRLHLPRTPESECLAQELLDYEIQVSEDANDRYGAFRVGSRDDLVTALGLAVHHRPPRWGIY